MKKKSIPEKPPRNSANHWLDEIADQISVGVSETVPEGWMRMQEIMDHRRETLGESRIFCEAAIAEGVMERKKFKIRLPGQGCRAIWHYSRK
jgi:hypothetical protein